MLSHVAADFTPFLKGLPPRARLTLRALIGDEGAVMNSNHVVFERLLGPCLQKAGEDAAGNVVMRAHLPWHGRIIQVGIRVLHTQANSAVCTAAVHSGPALVSRSGLEID